MKLKQIQKTQGDILELEENHHHEIADGMTTVSATPLKLLNRIS
jgi:hypothetical protein